MYEDIYKEYKKVSKDYINRDLFNKSQDSSDLLDDIKKNKLVIYTAFTKGYDSLKEPEFVDENCDYICFTNDQNLKSEIWDIKYMEDSILDNNRKAKEYKVLSHKYLAEYKYSFWLDGTFKIKDSIREYIYKYLKKDSKILCVIHPERGCIYDEFKASKKITRYPAVIMEKQTDKYKKEGFPSNYGLPVLGAIFRKHNSKEIIKLMEDWWGEIMSFSNQDQLSFPYVAWKNNIHPSVSDIYYWNNSYWTKEKNKEDYHHNVLLRSPDISDNILKKILKSLEESSSDNFNISKEELNILINEIYGLEGHYQYLNKKIKENEKEINLILNSTSMNSTKYFRKIVLKLKNTLK